MFQISPPPQMITNNAIVHLVNPLAIFRRLKFGFKKQRFLRIFLKLTTHTGMFKYLCWFKLSTSRIIIWADYNEKKKTLKSFLPHRSEIHNIFKNRIINSFFVFRKNDTSSSLHHLQKK